MNHDLERKSFGATAEVRGLDYLLKNRMASGSRVIAQGFRIRGGEIDLILEEPREGGWELVFVEVRARRAGRNWQTGLESVGQFKKMRLARVISYFLATYRGRAISARVDVLDWDGVGWQHAPDAIRW